LDLDDPNLDATLFGSGTKTPAGGSNAPPPARGAGSDLDLDDPNLDATLFGSGTKTPAGGSNAPPPARSTGGDLDLDDPNLDATLFGSGTKTPTGPSSTSAGSGGDLDLDDPSLDSTLFGSGTKGSTTNAKDASSSAMPLPEIAKTDPVPDPLEHWNRFMFDINDFFYVIVLSPVAASYEYVIPETGRSMVTNFFENLSTPIYFVNALLQGKVRTAGNELARFSINTTLGVGGLLDPADNQFQIKGEKEDFGNTLSDYGLGEGIYFVWPLLGPTSGLETLGYVGDTLLSPLTYCPSDRTARFALNGVKTLNKAGPDLKTFQSIKKAALDPYVSLRDAYWQTLKRERNKRRQPKTPQNKTQTDTPIDQPLPQP
jgi:phospholipid-binding lipoprotein MlaA